MDKIILVIFRRYLMFSL